MDKVQLILVLTKADMVQQIPPAYRGQFEKGIRHPLLFLWDAWSYVESDVIHLYCLAVSRFKPDSAALLPSERNDFPFHVRHFTSENNGRTWTDEGCFLKPQAFSKQHSYRTIWSGSVEALPDGKKLVAFTGIEEVDADHNFLQTIGLASSEDGYTIERIAETALSSPRRDWAKITATGYYLDAPEKLGSNDGEGEGPILSWRDPFIFLDIERQVNLFWGAKVSTRESALARAVLQKNGELYNLAKLFPPIMLPDGNEFTQLELPKVLHDKEKDLYYLIISSCNRLFEGQADADVDKGLRVYKSNSLEGPWEALGAKILGPENLFGLTVLSTDFESNRLLCIAPYTDAAEKELSLTFSPVFYLYLDSLKVVFL